MDESLRAVDMKHERIVRVKLPDSLCTEVLLVLGSAFEFRPHQDVITTYWQGVWRFVVNRYPDLVHQTAYPHDWSTDITHKHDMEILTEILMWQRRQISKDLS